MSVAVIPRTAIRLMLPSDLDSVWSVEHAAYDYPWSQGVFRDCLLAGYYSLVLEVADFVSGYGIMSVAASEAHILNLCVHPSLHRMGYGRRMLDSLLAKAEETTVKKVFLEVRPSNIAAIQLYASVGFEQIGIRPSYYQSRAGREDAVVLSRDLRPTG